MLVHGDYDKAGYAFIEQLVPSEITQHLLDQIWRDLRAEKLPVTFSAEQRLLARAALELHGSKYPPLTTFLWGMTPTASALTGCDLLPTYCFFRLYQRGDILKVHSDRNACEHSLSLTLGYADEMEWGFQVGHMDATSGPGAAAEFGDEEYASISMSQGDGVLYRGIQRRHGRLTPNPNQWSAHLFLHWVDKNGPFSSLAFEGLSK